jgi:short subunit dehydrogenase-like uncharacterized protein
VPDLDLTVWGATGYTGRLVAKHVAARAPEGLRWALGGRDASKLEQIRAEIAPRAEIVTADALVPDSIDALVRGTRTLASTVGPYALYGTPLVEACVRHGIDYCDIAAEPQWIRANIDQLHTRARETHAHIVHCCGFDSIPSDLGVWALHDHLERAHPGTRLSRVEFYIKRMRGGLSGGTLASILNLLEQASRDRNLRRLLADPYSLNPEGERSGPDGRDRQGTRYCDELGRWTAPFVMAGINTRIVRRTNALLGYPYGREFRYDESVLTGGRFGATMLSAAISAFMLGGYLSPTRWLMRRLLPAPGRGPTESARRDGFFDIVLRGRVAGSSNTTAHLIEAKVAGDLDPGYGMTAIMLAESALCLTQTPPSCEGGVLTPAAAMARPLLERLRAAGMRFEVEGR